MQLLVGLIQQVRDGGLTPVTSLSAFFFLIMFVPGFSLCVFQWMVPTIQNSMKPFQVRTD